MKLVIQGRTQLKSCSENGIKYHWSLCRRRGSGTAGTSRTSGTCSPHVKEKIKLSSPLQNGPNLGKIAPKQGLRPGSFVNPLSEAFSGSDAQASEWGAAGTPWPNHYRSLQDYCSRAWCRLEVLLCASLALRDGGFR